MDTARVKYLFDRYVKRQCSEAEKAEFIDLIGDARHNVQLQSLLDELWNDTSGAPMAPDRSEAILDKILEEESRGVPLHQSKSFSAVTKIAASLALLICSGMTIFFLADRKNPSSNSMQASADLVPRGFIRLPDGSSVILNEGSHLDYPQTFDGGVREVTLTGEGYFDISHDPVRPFVVHTGKVRTTVLGTAFNIKAYPHQADITVTVARGKVKVSDDKQVFAIVNPDQQITLSKNRDIVEQKTVDSHQVTAWMEKDIYFDDITIGEAIDQLEKRFQIKITFGDSNIRDCRFTATFVKGENIEQILRILCEFNNATLEENAAGDYEIHGGECSL